MGTRYNRLAEAVLTSTHNLCFEQKYEKYQKFLSENFQFLEVNFSIYLNRRVFVMLRKLISCSHFLERTFVANEHRPLTENLKRFWYIFQSKKKYLIYVRLFSSYHLSSTL